MPEVSGLSTAFAASHPEDAARALQELAAADTASFISALEPRLAATILRNVDPPYCARVLDLLDDAAAAALIQIMGPQPAARILQQMPAARQMRLLARLSVATSVAVRLLIGYPQGTCGACMDPWTLMLDAEMAAEEALAQVRRFEGALGDCLFVTNGQQRLAGVLAFAELVRAAPRSPLATLMRPATHAVSALAAASTIVAHPAWDIYHVLPVVERENRLVGALHRRTLAAAIAGPAAVQTSAMGGLFGAYWQMLSALAGIVIGTLPPVAPVASERSKDER
jgi:magnesium transporter